ncbi:hypothetical protein [Sphingobium phenoxybenzoativorans]|uniref:hypothetical protein n=1 Tax=Sphingobium phenoxybenzoativorans TaxID=1592790 RepID=UPI000A8726E8|nr:hypothetical protein [Sphingobium phenoxybenzoativorans]
MNSLVPTPSRQTLRTGPVISAPDIGNAVLVRLRKAHRAEPTQLLRTREGRNLSRARYRRAEEFMSSLAPEAPQDWHNFLYHAGIVAQLALSSHLLDVGFSDVWCARHIGLNVARSLAYANATGFDYAGAEIKRLADVLSPYSKWNRRSLADDPQPNDAGFTTEEVRILLRAMLGHVRNVTGHDPL